CGARGIDGCENAGNCAPPRVGTSWLVRGSDGAGNSEDNVSSHVAQGRTRSHSANGSTARRCAFDRCTNWTDYSSGPESPALGNAGCPRTGRQDGVRERFPTGSPTI